MNTEIQKKENFKDLIKKYSKIIYLIILIFVIFGISYIWLDSNNKSKKIKISENFIEGKVLLQNKKLSGAKEVFVGIINEKDNVYSPLSLFLIIDKNLEEDQNKITNYFDLVLSIKDIEEEDRNSIILKKAIFISENNQEEDMLNLLNPIINSESVWKLQSAKFIGDYYFSKKQFKKAKEYYSILLNEEIETSEVNEIKRKINIIDNE